MSRARILAFAGSTRRESFNQRLLNIAASGAKQAGADVSVVNLGDYPLPIFDQDLEAESGAPEQATALKRLFREHDGLLIASPEYNSSLTALLKNAIDWVSRSEEGEAPLAAFQGKYAALMSASPGGLGGIRGLVHLRAILGNIGVTVLPQQIAISKAHEAFDSNGQLTNSRQQQSVEELGASLAAVLAKIHA